MNEQVISKSDSQIRGKISRGFNLIVRVVLGAVFIFASIDKIWHPEAFSEVIYNYQILPDQFINITAILLPWLELVLGGCLLAGLWLPGAVVLANMLLLTFFGSLIFNIARGLDINCGCFSSSTESVGSATMAWYVLRDSFFLFLGGYLFFRLPRLSADGGKRKVVQGP
jgi:uncharacterized membrane protein YphA (DoxX/SURF4 family)